MERLLIKEHKNEKKSVKSISIKYDISLALP